MSFGVNGNPFAPGISSAGQGGIEQPGRVVIEQNPAGSTAIAVSQDRDITDAFDAASRSDSDGGRTITRAEFEPIVNDLIIARGKLGFAQQFAVLQGHHQNKFATDAEDRFGAFWKFSGAENDPPSNLLLGAIEQRLAIGGGADLFSGAGREAKPDDFSVQLPLPAPLANQAGFSRVLELWRKPLQPTDDPTVIPLMAKVQSTLHSTTSWVSADVQLAGIEE